MLRQHGKNFQNETQVVINWIILKSNEYQDKSTNHSSWNEWMKFSSVCLLEIWSQSHLNWRLRSCCLHADTGALHKKHLRTGSVIHCGLKVSQTSDKRGWRRYKDRFIRYKVVNDWRKDLREQSRVFFLSGPRGPLQRKEVIQGWELNPSFLHIPSWCWCFAGVQ